MTNEPLTTRLSQAARNITRSTTMPEEEFVSPTFATVFKGVWQQLRIFRFERAAQIVGSAFVLLMLWCAVDVAIKVRQRRIGPC